MKGFRELAEQPKVRKGLKQTHESASRNHRELARLSKLGNLSTNTKVKQGCKNLLDDLVSELQVSRETRYHRLRLMFLP
jgi:hypothetical protein